MELFVGLALIVGLILFAEQVKRDSQEFGCGCTAGLVMIFALVVFGVIAVATGGTFQPK